jgi:predicted lipid-binding transport protein (Tim44 family)
MSVTEQIEDHQARCLTQLISLRMLAQTEPGALLPRRVVLEIARATGAVVAEAEAGGQAVLAAAADEPQRGDGTFLRVRLDRLAAAAEDAVAAARAGDSAELRRHLRRFDTLTAAIWTVQDALYGAHPVPGRWTAAP